MMQEELILIWADDNSHKYFASNSDNCLYESHNLCVAATRVYVVTISQVVFEDYAISYETH